MSLSLVSLHLLESWRRWQRLFLCVSGRGPGGGTTVRRLPAAKQAQQTVFKDGFFTRRTAAVPDKSTNEGQWNFVRRVRGFLCGESEGKGEGGGESGPQKEESQEDVVLEMAGWTTLNVRFFWTEMPAQVAAVEAATSPPSSTPPPPPPPLPTSSQWGNCFNETTRALTERD